MENVEAILNQAYTNFRVIIVTDSTDDPAYSIVSTVLKRHSTKNTRLCTADVHPSASGKVAALLTALNKDNGASEAYAFVDSDSLTTRHWLRDLLDPLQNPLIGATTGFRWYFPERSGFWAQVESAWNASGTNVMFSEKYNFPWGGAMAMLREKMDEIHLEALWETAISDDLSLNRALRDHNLRVDFVPKCTVVTYSQSTGRSFLGWASRQTTLTRAFNRGLWEYGLVAYGFFTVLSILGAASLIAGLTISREWLLPGALLLAPSIVGVIRSSQRVTTFERALPEFALDFERNRLAHSIASLIVPWVMTYCITRSVRTQIVEWRGRKYKLTGQAMHAPT